MRTHLSFQNHNDSSLFIYLKEINKFKLLSAEDEQDLGSKILDGDRRAVDKLINANLRFVVSVAKKYEHMSLALCDLINEGNKGLIIAANKFDIRFGCKFITYAVWYIKQAMQDAVKKNATIKIPNNKLETIYQINKSIRHLEQELHRKPTATEISNLLQIKEQKVKDCIHYNQIGVSMDATTAVLSIKNTLADVGSGVELSLDKISVTLILLHLIHTLNKRQATIIEHFYGIGYPVDKNLDEIAIIMNLSKERVRQLKDIAIKELKRRGVDYLRKFGIFGS
jgi:RNA polymerase primary sigma factor